MYNYIDDTEILYMVNEVEDGYEFLIAKYKPLLIKLCKKYEHGAKYLGFELEDLMQVANLGVMSAISTYRDTKDTSFSTYLTHCVDNRLKTEIRNQTTSRKMSLNKALSYDAFINGTKIKLLDTIPDRENPTPFECILEENREKEYINFVNSLPFEVAIAYEMRIFGYKLEQIGNFLEISKRTVSNYINYAKNELLKNKWKFE